jgi:hypothetical protein
MTLFRGVRGVHLPKSAALRVRCSVWVSVVCIPRQILHALCPVSSTTSVRNAIAPGTLHRGIVGPDASDDFDRWLRNFLDALGVPRTSFITDALFEATFNP